MFKNSTNEQVYIECLVFLLSKNSNSAAEQKGKEINNYSERKKKLKSIKWKIIFVPHFTVKLCGANYKGI